MIWLCRDTPHGVHQGVKVGAVCVSTAAGGYMYAATRRNLPPAEPAGGAPPLTLLMRASCEPRLGFI